MKEACNLLIYFANQYPQDFEAHSHRYVNDECLLKALSSGKKVIVDLAHECISAIFKSTSNNR